MLGLIKKILYSILDRRVNVGCNYIYFNLTQTHRIQAKEEKGWWQQKSNICATKWILMSDTQALKKLQSCICKFTSLKSCAWQSLSLTHTDILSPVCSTKIPHNGVEKSACHIKHNYRILLSTFTLLLRLETTQVFLFYTHHFLSSFYS